MSERDIAEAGEHPDQVAKRHDMDTATLQQMISGELHTVMGAYIDYTSSRTPLQVDRAEHRSCCA